MTTNDDDQEPRLASHSAAPQRKILDGSLPYGISAKICVHGCVIHIQEPQGMCGFLLFNIGIEFVRSGVPCTSPSSVTDCLSTGSPAMIDWAGFDDLTLRICNEEELHSCRGSNY